MRAAIWIGLFGVSVVVWWLCYQIIKTALLMAQVVAS